MELNILWWIRNNLTHPLLDDFFLTYTNLGQWAQIWIAIMIALLLFKKTRKLAILMIIALIVEFVINDFVLKEIFTRSRPFNATDVKLILPAPTSFSFPSGHTASSFAVAMVAFFKDFKYKWWLLVLAALMAYSRLYLFVHYPTDVLAGIVVGTLVAYLVVAIDNRVKKE